MIYLPLPSSDQRSQLSIHDPGVSLALRYWAASYDNEENSGAQLVAMTLHTSLNRWRSIPSMLLHPLGARNEPFSTMGTGNDTTDYWLKVYVILGAVNLALYGGRVSGPLVLSTARGLVGLFRSPSSFIEVSLRVALFTQSSSTRSWVLEVGLSS